MTVRQNRFSVGDIIDGKYEVVRVLPAGGMGELYKVRHIHLNDFRAVKVLKAQMLTDATQKQRFLREAKIAASIKHPNLASLFDFSSLPDGSYYMVQEFIDGVTLIETINAGEVFDVPFILRIGQQVLGGLASLHEEGIIHRDISPDNLMLTKTNSGSTTIKIIDLGIAKPIDAGEGLTNAGFFVGKLHYASPEQAGMIEPGEKVDHRTDLYSLGVVLYQMVARRLPFAAENPQAYFLKQVSQEVAPINRPGEPPLVPVELEQFVLRMLRKNRNERFSSATEALNELVMISARLSTVAPSFVPEDTTRSVQVENPPLGGYVPPAIGDDTDLFGNPVDAPVFSSSLGSTPLGQSPADRTTAELPLINIFPSIDRADDVFHQQASNPPPDITGDFPFDDAQQSPPIETDAVDSSPPGAGAAMSDQARAIFSLDQQPTTVQEIPTFPTQIDSPTGQNFSRTVVEPAPSSGSYGALPISAKTMMQDDTVSTLDSPVSPSGTVVQNIGPQGMNAGGAAAPVYPPAAGVPIRPVKRKSGALWIVLALVVLLLGAALFAALRFLPFSPFAGDPETTTTIADVSTTTGDPGGIPIVPVETPTPTPEPTPIVDPLDLITQSQTAISMGTTMGPDFVPTPTPRATPRTRVTPRAQTPTPTRTTSTPTPTPPPSTPVPVREGELVEAGSAGVTDARISKWSPPRYPRGAERQRAEGTTTLRVLVGPGGQIEEVRVATSSGFKILDDEAINVAQKSSFAPATKNGVRVRMWIPVRVSFQRP